VSDRLGRVSSEVPGIAFDGGQDTCRAAIREIDCFAKDNQFFQ
jgi:hypothetical protein